MLQKNLNYKHKQHVPQIIEFEEKKNLQKHKMSFENKRVTINKNSLLKVY